MGLNLSVGEVSTFQLSYGGFNAFRQCIARAAGGGSFPPHAPDAVDDDGVPLDQAQWYWGDGYSPSTHPGLAAFFSHSDCDGELAPEDCGRLAAELASIQPQIERVFSERFKHSDDVDVRLPFYAGRLRNLIELCRHAHSTGQPIEFY